ncbi:hypothetical protein NKR23_g9773 [Pleurostoma richardsiae]|uniref:Uncharacterized protein n=1 Tax=Pleurostoma richardsiae TaxID=41990 RepID=A0AA38R6G7_9PEZI|nr:hypothetical protein NKR23_g9773 [Pleurostoma richardsiae]
MQPGFVGQRSFQGHFSAHTFETPAQPSAYPPASFEDSNENLAMEDNGHMAYNFPNPGPGLANYNPPDIGGQLGFPPDESVGNYTLMDNLIFNAGPTDNARLNNDEASPSFFSRAVHEGDRCVLVSDNQATPQVNSNELHALISEIDATLPGTMAKGGFACLDGLEELAKKIAKQAPEIRKKLPIEQKPDLEMAIRRVNDLHHQQLMTVNKGEYPASLEKAISDALRQGGICTKDPYSGHSILRDLTAKPKEQQATSDSAELTPGDKGSRQRREGRLHTLKAWIGRRRHWRESLAANNQQWPKLSPRDRHLIITLQILLNKGRADSFELNARMAKHWQLVKDCHLEYLTKNQEAPEPDQYWSGFEEALVAEELQDKQF